MSDQSLISAFANPRSMDEQLASIHEATPDTAAARIKIIEANKDGYTPAQVLLIFETALTREVRTKPQRRLVIDGLKKAIKRASPPAKSPLQLKAEALQAKATKLPIEQLADARRTPHSALRTSMTETPTTAMHVLKDIDAAITDHLKSIVTKLATFEDSILADRLKVGLYALKAHMLFAIKAPGKRNAAGRNQATSAADVASPQGFEGWLEGNYHPVDHPLKKGTAYAWMTALKGLGLDENATEEEIDEAVRQNQRIGPVSIKSLGAAAVEALATPAPLITPPVQTEFEFLRDGLSAFREQADALLALKQQLHDNPNMERVATARVYGLLHSLTGTHWTPSNEPDDLASVNPDAIEL